MIYGMHMIDSMSGEQTAGGASMSMSHEIGALAAALSKAQAAMRPAAKDRDNPFFKSTYATLAAVIEAIRDPLSVNGLAFCQPTRVDASGRVVVVTLLMHSSGQWISGECSATPVKSDPQGVGSLISYMKRYGLQAMVGVASADDDANAASNPARTDPTHSDPVGFDPTNPAHRQHLQKQLKDMGVKPGLWPLVSQAMVGRSEDDFGSVVTNVINSSNKDKAPAT